MKHNIWLVFVASAIAISLIFSGCERKSPREVEVTLTFDSYYRDFDLYLYDADYNIIARSEGYSSTESVSGEVPIDGTVHIGVVSASGSGDFHLTIGGDYAIEKDGYVSVGNPVYYQLDWFDNR